MNEAYTPLADSLNRVSRLFHIDADAVAAVPDAIEHLQQQDGIAAVGRTEKPGVLRVSYDITRLDAGAVNALLADAGLTPADSRWQRLRITWFAMLDGNQRDNARHQPACCSKPPGVARRD